MPEFSDRFLFLCEEATVTDCAKCGACTAVCPVYGVTGRESLTARGKIHLLERLPPRNYSSAYADILSKCLLCGACESSCPRGLPLLDRITRARQNLPLLVGRHPLLTRLAEMALRNPSLLATCTDFANTLQRILPADSGLRIRLGLTPPAATLPEPLPGEGEQPSPQQPVVAYFNGCLARYPQPAITRATEKLLINALGAGPLQPTTQTCCGQAAYSSGNRKDAVSLAKQNISAFADTTLPILTSCASCYHHLSTYPALLKDEQEWVEPARAFAQRLREFSSFFTDDAPLALKQQRTAPQTVFYHDPCHLRFPRRILEPPRHLLREAGYSLQEHPHGPQCCGMGGLFHLAQPELAENIRDRLLSGLSPRCPDLVTTTCSGCLIQLGAGLHPQRDTTSVHHLAVLLAGQLTT